MGKLNEEEIVTLQVLKDKGESNRAIARQLEVSESVVRYHLKRKASGTKDGRVKQALIEKLQLAEVVDHWWKTQIDLLPKNRSPSIQQLFDHLTAEHDFTGSYKSVRKYVRATFEKPKLRAVRRIETPPGAQTQSDWMEEIIDCYGPNSDRTFDVHWSELSSQFFAFITALIWPALPGISPRGF